MQNQTNDLSDYQKLQQELHDLKKLIDSSLDIICSIDEEGKFASVSAASKRIWGYEPLELIGKKYIELVLDEDVELTLSATAEIKNGRDVTIFENRYKRKDLSVVPLLWSARWNEEDKMIYCIAREATEKKLLQMASESERQHLEKLFRHVPVSAGIFIGPDHVFEMANDLYLQLTGRENIIGKTVREVFPEVKNQGLFELLDHVYTTGEVFSAKERLIRVNKAGNGNLEEMYLNFVYEAYRDDKNNIKGVFFFAADVTEQVLSRKKIEQSEKQYRQIVETAQEGIWLIDENDKTVFVNNKICEILEYPQEEMLGKDIYQFMDEEGKQIARQLMDDKKKGAKGQVEFKYLSKYGKQIWTNISSNPIIEEGIYKGSLAMVSDITGKKLANEMLQQSEQKYRILAVKMEQERTRLVNAQAVAKVGSWETEFPTLIVTWSAETYRIFEKDSLLFNPTHLQFVQLIHPEDVKKVDEAFTNSANSHGSNSIEHRIITPKGIEKYIIEKWEVLYDEIGQPLRAIGTSQDITEQKKSEDKLRQSEYRYRNIVETAQEGIWMIDENNKTTFVNRKMCEILEYTEAEMMEKTNLSLKEEQDQPQTLQRLELRKQGISETHESKFITKSGRHIWTIVSTNPIFDADGEFKGSLAMVSDITERKEAEIKLKRANEQQAAILDALPPHIALLDNKGIIFGVNEAWKKFGIENGMREDYEWIGQNYLITSGESTGEDKEYATKIAEKIPEVISGKIKQFSMEYPCHTPKSDGWFKVIVSQLMNKTDEGAVVLHIDITERKLAEEKLQEKQEQLLESQRIAHIGSWQLNFPKSKDIDSSLVQCSQETCRIFDFPTEECDFSFRIFSHFIHLEDRKMVMTSFEKAIDEKTGCSIDCKIVRRDESIRWTHVEAKVLTDLSNGEPTKMVGTIKDVTVEKDQHLQLENNANEREILIGELSRSIKDLRQFTYITSHNFRAPLSNLIALQDLVDYSSLTEENREVMEMFKNSTLHLNKIINDLMQILIIRNNKNINVSSNNVNKLLHEVTTLLAHDIHETGCTININLQVENITFNTTYLESILMNLLSNALKYRSPARTLQIDIKTFISSEGKIVLTVKDNGLGIDLTRHRGNMFGMYQRFHSNADSVGLGLFIVKSQLNSMGGDIEVESEVDKGTCFSLTFKD